MSNEFDAAVTTVLNPDTQADTAQSARTGYLGAVETNPDAYAEAQRVARRVGVPTDVALAMPKDIQKQAAVGEINFDTLAKTSPATASLLSDMDKAKIAHDDVPGLQAVERTFIESLVEPVQRGYAQGKRGMAMMFRSMGFFDGLDKQRAAVAKANGVDYDPTMDSAVYLSQLQRNVEKYPVPDDIQQGMTAISQAPDFATAFDLALHNKRAVAETILQSLGTSAPALGMTAAGSFAGPLGTAAGAGLGSFAVEYGSTLQDTMAEKGIDPTNPGDIHRAMNDPAIMDAAKEKALKRGVPVALFDAITAGVAGKILAGAKPTAASVAPRVAGEMAVQAGGGAAGEAAAQVATDEWKPGDILMEALAELPTGLVEVPGNYRDAMEKARANEKQRQAIDNLTKLSAASKVVQRDADTFEQFVQQASENGPVEHVYIDANTLMQSGVAEQVAEVSPAVREQLPLAAQTGGQIAIPVGEYAARIAPNDFAQSLVDHLKTDPEGFSRVEAQEFMQSHQEELAREIERSLGNAAQDDAFKQSADRLKAKFQSELDALGHHTPDVNKAYSTLLGDYFAVNAAKLGMTPEDLHNQYAAKFASEMQGGYDQAGNLQTDTEAFKNWFGDSKVVDAEGKPLVVYHGGSFDENIHGIPDTEGRPRKGWQLSFGMHFAKNVSEAKAYIPVKKGKLTNAYLRITNPLYLEPEYNADTDSKIFHPMSKELHDSLPDKVRKAYDKLYSNAFADGYGFTEWLEPIIDKMKPSEAKDLIQSLGFDGVFYVAKANYGDGRYRPFSAVITFDPTQIKSATGNTGAFDPNNPNILHQPARGAFNPDTLTISLLKDADLSTFLHETGHFFLEMQFDLASKLQKEADIFGMDSLRPGEQEILRDTQTLLNWFGVPDLNAWYAMDIEQKRPFHEQFARGFEAYLFEGKAPSIEMQSLFQKFRAWLVRVYKSIESLNVRLTDEVRGVFDRMIASEEQIDLAQQARSMMPLFTSLDTAPMSPDEFERYQAMQREATDEAVEQLQARGLRDMQWLQNARSRLLKKLQKQHDELRREVRSEVRLEVMAMPVYRAWSLLTGKITDDDKLPPNDRRKSDPSIVDPEIDSLATAIAKLGGLNKQELIEEWGIDPKYNPASGVFGKPVLRRTGGLSREAMAEHLVELGYLTPERDGKHDLREFEEKLDNQLRGKDQFSNQYVPEVESRAGDQAQNPAALNAARLDLAELANMGLPAEIVNVIKAHRMTASNGMHPDIVADLIGYSSGDEMVRALAMADKPKDAIEALTDVRMLEQHGDLATPQALEKAADAAIHNDVRARMVATEANALAKATGQRKILASAAKELAAHTIDRKKVRDVNAGQFTNAEARAAKSAAQYMAKGDLANAAAEKRNQLFNMYAAKAAMDAKDFVEKALKYLKKFNGDIKGLDVDYADQIAGLLSRFDLRKISNKEVDRRIALARWLESQRDAGLEPDIPEALQNEAYAKSYKELTIEEFRGLVDAVKQIEHLGRLKKKLLTARDQREYEAVRDEIATSINEHSQDRVADTRTPTTNTGRALKSMKAFAWAHAKVGTLARILDGGKDGGPLWRYLIQPANERGDMETTMRAEATAALSEIMAPVFAQGKMGGSGMAFPSIGRSLNRESRIAIALNVGNAGNLQRLLGGEGWTMQHLQPILDTLTAADWQAVQAIWDHFETYRPLIAAKERRVYGKEPNWIEPTPFTIQSADGQRIDLRGGYYPIKYDPAASQRAEEHADAEGAKRQLQGAYTSATTRRSFTKTRAEEIKGRPLLYTLAGMYSGVNDVIHDLAWHEWLIDSNRLLKSNKIDAAIRTHYGPEVKQQFKSWSADIAEGEKGLDHATDIALSRLRQGVSVAGLGFNLMSALMQPTGIVQSVSRVGARWIGLGVSKYLAHPIDTTEEVNDLSEFMRNRARTRFRELNELRNQVQDQTAFNEAMGRYAYFLMMRCQQMVDVPTWWGAYQKAQAEGFDEGKAIALADQAVIDSQGSGMTKDLSAIERGGQAQRLFTVFYSYMNTGLNLGISATMSAEIGKRKAKLAAEYALLYVVPVVLGMAIKDALTPSGDDDDDYFEKLPKRLVAAEIDYLMGLMVVVREFSEAAKLFAGVEDHKHDYQGPAGLRAVVDAGKFAYQASQGEFDTAFRKETINLLGDIFGLPSAQINRTWTGVDALAEGETNNPLAIAFGYKTQR